MKNLFILSAIAISFAACNSTASETQELTATDSVAAVDSTTVIVEAPDTVVADTTK